MDWNVRGGRRSTVAAASVLVYVATYRDADDSGQRWKDDMLFGPLFEAKADGSFGHARSAAKAATTFSNSAAALCTIQRYRRCFSHQPEAHIGSLKCPYSPRQMRPRSHRNSHVARLNI